MKKIVIISLFIALGMSFAQPIPTNLQFVLVESDPLAPPPNFEVAIQMSGAAPFSLGSSNIKFDFNLAGLASPVLVAPLGFDASINPFYAPITVTEPVPGVASINIFLFVPNNGDPIVPAPGWTDIAIVGFTIVDPTQTSQLQFRSMASPTDPTVVYQDNEQIPNIDGQFLPLDVPLPVELSEFTVEDAVDGVHVNWTTESEIENLGFLLERKTPDTDWQKIASYKDNDELLGQGTTSSTTNYEYVDNLVEVGGEYEYGLADVDYNGVVTYHSTRIITVNKLVLEVIPDKFELFAAYPNPFNPTATIRYNVPTESVVKITVYNQLGNIVRVLQNGLVQPGEHSIIWNARDNFGSPVSAGIYLYNIQAGTFNKTQKMILLK